MITIQTFDKKKNRKVVAGVFYEESKIYVKTVKGNHYMVKERGYGIQGDIIEDLINLDCQQIYIYSQNKKHKCLFQDWLKKCKIKDYGHGNQSFMPVKEMELW